MLIPKVDDYKQIKGHVSDYMDVHMAACACGGGCSCLCKQMTVVSIQKIYVCLACSCNTSVMRELFKEKIDILT